MDVEWQLDFYNKCDKDGYNCVQWVVYLLVQMAVIFYKVKTRVFFTSFPEFIFSVDFTLVLLLLIVGAVW